MATADESETQRFYLRKIEGAEILLTYETNFFRQELHKWSPVATEPPPILEVSKSTRKPRPTKLQKLMAQHGVDDPEALPQNVRTKTMVVKRKPSDASLGRPQPLQPAPGRSDSGTPTSHNFPTGPMYPPHSAPLSDINGQEHGHLAQYGAFVDPPQPHFTMSPPSNASPALAPHAFMGGGMQSPGFGGPLASPRTTGIFNDTALSRIDPAIDSTLGTANGQDIEMGDAFAGGSQGITRMFDELTNQENEDGAKAGESADPKASKEVSEDDPSRGNDKNEGKWDGDDDMTMFFDGP
jgi:histone demethylase JARID1